MKGVGTLSSGRGWHTDQEAPVELSRQSQGGFMWGVPLREARHPLRGSEVQSELGEGLELTIYRGIGNEQRGLCLGL